MSIPNLRVNASHFYLSTLELTSLLLYPTSELMSILFIPNLRVNVYPQSWCFIIFIPQPQGWCRSLLPSTSKLMSTFSTSRLRVNVYLSLVPNLRVNVNHSIPSLRDIDNQFYFQPQSWCLSSLCLTSEFTFTILFPTSKFTSIIYIPKLRVDINLSIPTSELTFIFLIPTSELMSIFHISNLRVDVHYFIPNLRVDVIKFHPQPQSWCLSSLSLTSELTSIISYL